MERDAFRNPRPTPLKADAISLGTEKSPTGAIVVFINGEPYSLIILPLAENSECRCQFRITKMNRQSYVVTFDDDGHAHCDCPSYIYSKDGIDPKGCKHCGALRNAGLANMVYRRAK